MVKTDVFATFAEIKVPWKILMTFRVPREQKGSQNGAQREAKRDQLGVNMGSKGNQRSPNGSQMGAQVPTDSQMEAQGAILGLEG